MSCVKSCQINNLFRQWQLITFLFHCHHHSLIVFVLLLSQSLLNLKDRFDHFLNNSFSNDRLFKQAISSVSYNLTVVVLLVAWVCLMLHLALSKSHLSKYCHHSCVPVEGWWMIHARLCEKLRLASFFLSLRNFDFLNCETKTSVF